MLPGQSARSSASPLTRSDQGADAGALPAYLQCSHEVVCGLIETASAALFSHFPKAVGDTLDVELVLDALRVFRPKVTEIGMLDGVLHIVHGRWDDAAHALRAVIDQAPDFAYAKAMMAYCLASRGEPGWRQWAHSALEANPNAQTLALVRALEAREDLQHAMRDYRGGEFVIPESCQSLAEEAREAEARKQDAIGCTQTAPQTPKADVAFDAQFAFLRA
ncbi:HrpB1 family type III secretion system apparatus protein [Paraburkholderia acidisoli]|uniref:HrpB1 family type III secretion system apparatus protein n=1 Tax=Paraburkholderia acidisoli TaxID=2571748 RepID=A0A7Z2GPZ3_9BURK|nr:HrpB1 family type III secretion system apparatus protein [Paraburkholderia acidisoli]QGZ65821.1 HrpB1 family type III secretion system apparatus protein [Paraburkholderia acidisoli]